MACFATAVCEAAPARSNSRSTSHSNYKVRFAGRLAYHAFEPRDLASHRYSLDFEQYHRFDPTWSITASARAQAEGAYSANSDRYDSVAAAALRRESSELALRDFYLQYQGSGLRIRAGNQQVAWGETFGSFFADLVNPKDLREYGLGDLQTLRIPVPMVSVKIYGATSGLELVYIPLSRYDRIPAIGSDFDPYSAYFQSGSLSVNNPTGAPLSSPSSEVGMRASAQVNGMDVSLIYLNYLDRQASFTPSIRSLSPLDVSLDATHSRVSSAGLTFSTDLSGLVLRLEGVHTFGRRLDAFDNGSFTTRIADQTVYAVEADYGGVQNWRFSLQWSGSRVSGGTTSLIGARSSALGARVSRDLGGESSAEILTSWLPSDQSSLWQLGFQRPISNLLEARIGADLFLGGGSTFYGALHGASRGYLELRAFFGQ